MSNKTPNTRILLLFIFMSFLTYCSAGEYICTAEDVKDIPDTPAATPGPHKCKAYYCGMKFECVDYNGRFFFDLGMGKPFVPVNYCPLCGEKTKCGEIQVFKDK